MPVNPPGGGRPVARRHVVYLPGYDPEARGRYRPLFVRELLRHARRIGRGRPAITRPTPLGDGFGQRWRVGPAPGAAGVETTYDVLLWDDLVARDLARPAAVSLALLAVTTLEAVFNGSIARFYRLHWKCANVVIYPFTAVVLVAAVAGALGAAAYVGLDRGLGLAPALALLLAASVGSAVVLLARRPLRRLYFWQLVNDWIFIWQVAHGRRADYERRLDAFAEHVLGCVAAAEAEGRCPDEIMIVGHSSGALTAVEVVARLIAAAPDLGAGTARLSLVTLGSSLPLVALQPSAAPVRERVRTLAGARNLTWVDYFAPQDWLNFPAFDPVRELALDGLGPHAPNPQVRSARFREILEPATYRKIRRKPFRMHFQFLMSNDRPGAYDYFGMVLGPQALPDWIATEAERLPGDVAAARNGPRPGPAYAAGAPDSA